MQINRPWMAPVASLFWLCSAGPAQAEDDPPPPPPVVAPEPGTAPEPPKTPAPGADPSPDAAPPPVVTGPEPAPPAPVIPPPKPELPAAKPPLPPPVPAPPIAVKPHDPFSLDRAKPISAMEPRKKSRRFIEGELANVGAIGLVPWENRFGVLGGIERIGDIFYASVTPNINFTTDLADRTLSLTFGIPVRLQLVDTRPVQFHPDSGETTGGWTNAMQLRQQDWDETADYAQLIRGIQYGSKEDRIYLDINAFKASSIGHGTIVKRYNPNLNLNSRQVSAEFDGFMDYGGVELYVNNVARPNLLAGLMFIKPLSLINRDNYALRSFSIGATVAADIDAPLRNRLDFDDTDNDGRRHGEYLVDQKNFQPQYISTQVVSAGLDTEIKLVDTKTTDWKTYVDYSILASGLPIDNADPRWDSDPTKPGLRGVMSSGMAWGHLLRLNLGDDPVHALRLRAEIRRYDANYVPSYFDTMYEIQRVQYRLGASRVDPTGTKLQQVLGRAPLPGEAKVFGLYFESSWKVSDVFAMAVAVETNDASLPDNSLFIHLEVPNYKGFQFLATLHRRAADSLGKLFDATPTTRDIVIVKARYGLASWLHLNVEALTPYGIGPDSFFANTVDINVNAELSFGYSAKGRK